MLNRRSSGAAVLATGILLGAVAVPCAEAAESAPKDEAAVIADVEAREADTESMARDLWDNPELGYLEFRTSKALIGALTKSGFTVKSGVAGIPTAFVASYGSGSPIIGILAEMDALPGKSQAAAPEQKEIPGKINNEGCGHNLFGPGSVSAAIAIKDWLVKTGHSGTIRLYGTPAEEGGSGKVYMVRAGLFDDADIVLHWHPAMVNAAIPVLNNAVISAKIRFHGKASHAGTSPERGRSALEAVEAMDNMVNMMRQHVRDGARISYVISKGGDAPNVVPDLAEVYYYVRESEVAEVKKLWERVLKAAAGAAMGTETTFDYEVIHATYNLLPNESLERMMNANLEKRAAKVIRWTSDEHEFAKKIYATIDKPWSSLGTEADVQPFGERFLAGSSDVGDVSWNVPTAGMVTTTWVPSTDAHTWQASATGRMGIGFKGMQLAAEVMAMTAVDLFQSPEAVQSAKQEFAKRRGENFSYHALLGDRPPPLDYRKVSQSEPTQ